jgi:long-chain acyl-CoA synthetase
LDYLILYIWTKTVKKRYNVDETVTKNGLLRIYRRDNMLVHQLPWQGKDEQVAFIGKQHITYRQLQGQIDQYRKFFYQQGVRPGENVGLFAKNSPEFVYSYMAIASLGAVVVPLNFQLVPREIAYILQDAKIKTLVTMQQLDVDTELEDYGYAQNVNQLIIPEFSNMLERVALSPVPGINVDTNDVCVIIYTSGTTGSPKGAVLTHKNLVSNAESFMQILPITAVDNVLCVLPMYHCFSWTCAVLASLMRGATITIMETFALKEAMAIIAEAGVTVVYGVPPMYNLFASRGVPEAFSNVQYFVSGGAALPEKVAEQFFQKFGKSIIEGYGLSEASPVVAINPVEQTKYCSIGKPLPGVVVRIVAEGDRDVDAGEVGELLVQGPNVMKGYYNLPDETAKVLRNGWLHTGDLAYRDMDGYLFIVDRLKDMIITSGENVYPREIEELLYAFPAIAEAAVVGIPDKIRGQAACAYVAMKEGQSLDKKALKEYLQANLAVYKIPREIKQVDALPKNSTGKILKRVLREEVGSERVC